MCSTSFGSGGETNLIGSERYVAFEPNATQVSRPLLCHSLFAAAPFGVDDPTHFASVHMHADDERANDERKTDRRFPRRFLCADLLVSATHRIVVDSAQAATLHKLPAVRKFIHPRSRRCPLLGGGGGPRLQNRPERVCFHSTRAFKCVCMCVRGTFGDDLRRSI